MTFGLLDLWLIIAKGTTYLIGVHITSVIIHLRLSNKIQKIEAERISSPLLIEESLKFAKMVLLKQYSHICIFFR